MTQALKGAKERDPFFDSLKIVLMFLVVFVHFIQPRIEVGDSLLYDIYTFLYLFHMPFFIFVSGYFSKNMTWAKYVKGTLPLIATLYIFQTIYSIPFFRAGGFDLLQFLLEPKSLMWYLLGLLVWRLIVCFVPKHKLVAPFLIFGSIGISLLLGFKMTTIIHNSTPIITLHESLRVVTFFPYFLLGYYCTPELINRIRSFDKLYAILALLFVFFCVHEYLPHDFRHSVYGTYSYKIVHPHELHIGFLYRFLTYPIAIGLSILVIPLIPSSYRLAKWGGMTFVIYLFHMLLFDYIYIPLLDQLGWSTSLVTDFVATILIIAGCVLLGQLRFIQVFMNPIGEWQQSKLRTK